jgi:hypothetical protein
MSLDFLGLGNERTRGVIVLPFILFGDDVVAELDTLITDVHRRACDQLTNFALRLSAERAGEISSGRGFSTHSSRLQRR